MTLASVLQMDERQHEDHHSRTYIACLASCVSECWARAAAQTLQAHTESKSLIVGISYIHIFSQASWHAVHGGADAVCRYRSFMLIRQVLYMVDTAACAIHAA